MHKDDVGANRLSFLICFTKKSVTSPAASGLRKVYQNIVRRNYNILYCFFSNKMPQLMYTVEKEMRMKEDKVLTSFTEQETECILDMTKMFIECFSDNDEVIDDEGFVILEKLDDWLGRRGLISDTLFDRILKFVYERREIYESDLLIPGIAEAVTAVYTYWPDMPEDYEMLMLNSLMSSCILHQIDERTKEMILSDAKSISEIIQEAVLDCLISFQHDEFIRRVNSFLQSQKENDQEN